MVSFSMRMERHDSTHALKKFRAANRLTSSARVVECRFVNLNPVIMIKQIPRRFDEALRMWGGFPLFMISPTMRDDLTLVCNRSSLVDPAAAISELAQPPAIREQSRCIGEPVS
jgi:hypothetical protein